MIIERDVYISIRFLKQNKKDNFTNKRLNVSTFTHPITHTHPLPSLIQTLNDKSPSQNPSIQTTSTLETNSYEERGLTRAPLVSLYCLALSPPLFSKATEMLNRFLKTASPVSNVESLIIRIINPWKPVSH